MILPGATDRLAFEAYVEQVLAPTLRPGQIVILDNLSAHHRAKVQHVVAGVPLQTLVLAELFPDLSPIELAFAKLKQRWRKAGARTIDALYDTISASLSAITCDDAHSFFTHCGYRTTPLL